MLTPFQSQDTYFASKNYSKRLIFQILITKILQLHIIRNYFSHKIVNMKKYKYKKYNNKNNNKNIKKEKEIFA